MKNFIQSIIILLIMIILVFIPILNAQITLENNQDNREIPEYFSFILGTDGILNVFPNIKPMEHPAVTNIKTRIKNIAMMLNAMGKTVEVRDILNDLWVHSYDPDWLWSSTYMDFVLAGNGVFVVSGHSSPYKYTVYRYGGIWAFSFLDFPPWWARWGNSVDILATDVGGFTRSMPAEALPSLIIMYGCNTGGYNNTPYNNFEGTWPWAYKFHVDDFQSSWRSRGFIGFLTNISFNSIDEPSSLIFIRKVIEYGINDYYLGAAVILGAYEANYNVLLDLYYKGRRVVHEINTSSKPRERAIYIGDYFAKIDPDEDDRILSTAYNFLKEWFPELYSHIMSKGIKPSVNIVKEGNNYARYSILWKGKDINIDVIVIRLYGRYYATGVTVGTGLRADEEITGTSRDLIERTRTKIDEFMNKIIDKAVGTGFSINASSENKNSSDNFGESITYTIYYNDVPVIVYTDSYLTYISVYKQSIELENTSIVMFETWIPVLIDIAEEKGFIQDKWRITPDTAAGKVKEVINSDIRLSSLRDLTVQDIEACIKRVFIATEDGLIPGYLAEISGGDIELTVVINGVDGGILKYNILYAMSGDNRSGDNILSSPYVGAGIIATIVAAILIAIIAKKRYRKSVQ